MLAINIARTETTPSIICDPENGVISMQGDSYPENSFDFFDDLLSWIDNYFTTTSQAIKLDLRLIYLNTSSVKIMMDIFDMLELEYQKGREVHVIWFYDSLNERVMELAEQFKEDCTFPFLITAEN